jgi:hypothetical protein
MQINKLIYEIHPTYEEQFLWILGFTLSPSKLINKSQLSFLDYELDH